MPFFAPFRLTFFLISDIIIYYSIMGKCLEFPKTIKDGFLMSKGFLKFWRRMLFASLWRSVLPGASLALGTFAVLLCLYKQMLSPLTPLHATCIALGAGLVLAAVLFAVLFPYKKRLARKLDRELHMREGVQTMLAYADRQDAIMQLQREQTDEKLRATPAKHLRIRHFGTCLVCFVLAIGMSVTAFAVPAKQPEPAPAPVEPPFELGEWETVALQNLIEEVRASTMSESAKTQTVASLESLLEALYTTKTQSRMKTLVVDTVVGVRGFVSDVVTLRAIAPILSQSGSSYTRKLERALAKQDPAEFKQALDAIAAELGADDTFDVAIHVMSDEIKMALRNSGADEQDMLYVELDRLANTLATVVEKLPDYTLTWGRMQINDAFGTAHVQMSKALSQQRYDAEMGAYVEMRLLEIFGLSASDLPAGESGTEQGPQTPGQYDDDDDDQSVSDGGMGSGELIVGSQDIIYDPTKDDHVKYSEVIDMYNAIFIESKIDGILSDEMAELIEAYFTALFSPSNKD